MTHKHLLFIFLASMSLISLAEESTQVKIYGFVRNEFYYNSRQNVEAMDGLFHFFPKPVELNNGVDINAVPQAQMLSIASRIGFDIKGEEMFGAKTSAKLEADFSGAGATYYLLRIRQAYTKFDWQKSSVLIGQTWHPLFNVMPVVMSYNTGIPFQPFNRSPQVRYNQMLGENATLIAAATFQMQYLSQGELGASNSYLKNSMLPSLFLGTEHKTKSWTSGVGVDYKRIKPTTTTSLQSFSAVAYSQYVVPGLQLRFKSVLGQNLSDQLMLGGYGVSAYNPDFTIATEYSNINNISSWINAVVGKKVQVGIFLGLSQNLGSEKNLAVDNSNKITLYGYGSTKATQQTLDQLYRVMPHISYNLPRLKVGVEYDLSTATYGTIQSDGRIKSPMPVTNHRAVASICYFF